MENAFYAEVLDPDTDQEVADGQTGELVLTTLKRTACPLFRYRTGDLVRKLRTTQLILDGGILGRIDDMVLVRGVNVYPSAIERVVRRFDDIGEFRVIQTSKDNMVELKLEIESLSGTSLAKQLQEALWDQFQLRIPVEIVEPGTLPEQEFKAQRWLSV